ncbi:hypothetical protein SAMN04487972_101174 [Paracoccus halophilus]|uniref:Phosphoadenosine phosphosulfate reductase n=1 Tax=Paracoccus halophilus TaxID=376733 RepID=A0A1I0SH02_9RHOB|nr:hypothetical protein [Paracoccus halophilus]SFA38713.1 hypothetical protein SAMN04487972_101174 [Paracoccus halophilus]
MAETSKPGGDDDDERLDDETAAAAAQPDPAPRWLVDWRRSEHRRGFYSALGDHALQFTDRGSDHLMVSFDNLSSARDDRIEREPWGYGFVAKHGWSQLGVLAFAPDWFRSDELFDALRQLAGNGFFRRFRSVTMTGTSMGGYAACAFASLVPGCRVIAFSPQSTLKEDLVPWEERFASGRRADWSGPFADAAEESAAAAQVFLVYDPTFEPDVKHAARFRHPNAIHLRTRYAGHKTALVLRRSSLLSTIVREAVNGELTASRFYAHYRQSRRLPWFLNSVADKAFTRERFGLSARMILFLRQRGQGFAAHKLRQKHIELSGFDPLSRPRAVDTTRPEHQWQGTEGDARPQ